MRFDFKKWNKITGWFIFLIASIVYLMTIESTASLWDCGEYITAAYKLEVGHPPGAPFFMIMGRLFSFFVDPENVAVCINALSALSSSFTILFMFWSLSLIIRKIISLKKDALDKGDEVIVLVASAIGSLAYTFTDSFWFSAVEGEVYAMSSLFTAVIFWAILKWDEEMGLIQKGVKLASSPNRWLLLIMFLLGLAIGVHLLGILVVPSIGYLIYFRLAQKVNRKGVIITGIVSILVLGFIQKGVIPGSIAMASSFEVFFVNSIGLPFYSGSIFFFALLITGLIYLTKYAQRNNKGILYNASLGLVFLLIGYGSFAVIVIRSNANTPLDENNPENLVTLRSYLEREQYGYTPLFSGPYWNSEENDRSEWESANPTYLRKFVVSKDGKDVKAFANENDAFKYKEKINGEDVDEKYFASNASYYSNGEVVYQPQRPTYKKDHTTLFPRMYSDDRKHLSGYIKWSGYDPNEREDKIIGKDNLPLPTFGENLSYFFNYQVNWMYWRYFMWNFSGRQNDIQGHGDVLRGNWISGISFIDNMRLGDQSAAPNFVTENLANNKFYMLPLILALIGLFFHFYTAPKDAFVLLLSFLFTGLAIVIYLNQKPFEPRERDYAYAGSFYFFAIWIGVGAYAIYHFLRDKNILKNNVLTAGATGAICLVVPILMAYQGWDDHNRHGRTFARDLANNYLESCSKNSILFTNGDNDTFPLWYLQEVEGKRTDVRVCNLSLLSADWYTNQMKQKVYDSDPLPIKFTEDQILTQAGITDYMRSSSIKELGIMKISEKLQNERVGLVEDYERMQKEFIKFRIQQNGSEKALSALRTFKLYFLSQKLTDFDKIKESVTDKRIVDLFSKGFAKLSSEVDTNNLENTILNRADGAAYFNLTNTLLDMDSSRNMNNPSYPRVNVREFCKSLKSIDDAYNSFEYSNELDKDWSAVELSKVMDYVRDEKNYRSTQQTTFFPTQQYKMNVNLKRLLNTGTITKTQFNTSQKIHSLLSDSLIQEQEIESFLGSSMNDEIYPPGIQKALDLQKLTKNDLTNLILYGYCPKTVKFLVSPDNQVIIKSDLMMLDIIGNNNWKRGIFFSGLSSILAQKLYAAGLVKKIGVAYEFSPLKNDYFDFSEKTTKIRGDVDVDKMYNNLMKVYTYGNMKDPGVLTDYYARRHVIDYRSCFASLARQFIQKKDYVESKIKDNENVNKLANQYALKAEKLLDLCQEKMPFEHISDIGDEIGSIGPTIVANYSYLGKFKKANALAKILIEDYRSIFNFFRTCDNDIVNDLENIDVLLVALNNCIELKKSGLKSKNKYLKESVDNLLFDIYKNFLSDYYIKNKDTLDRNSDFQNILEDMRNSLTPKKQT